MDYLKELKSIQSRGCKFVNALPKEVKGFNEMHDAALEDGILSAKEKELIALGISVVIKCEPCIVSHISSLIELKATREEILEALKVAFFMGGGPAMAYGSKALECYDQLSNSVENN